MAPRAPEATIHCFEPESSNFELPKQNLTRAGLRATARKFAISTSPGAGYLTLSYGLRFIELSFHFRAETIRAFPLPAAAQATPKSLTALSDSPRVIGERSRKDAFAEPPKGEKPTVSILNPASEMILFSVAFVKW